MRESVIYQEIEAEARGEARGKMEEGLNLVLRQLIRRVGKIAPDLETKTRHLSLTQLEDLGEALLDFSQVSDLVDWSNADHQ